MPKPSEFSKFSNEEEVKRLASGWKEQSAAVEETGLDKDDKKVNYFKPKGPVIGRVEERDERAPEKKYLYPPEQSIDQLHGFSVVEHIKEIIKEKGPAYKVKVLDMGGGAAVFAEQLRKIFGANIEVYTTGLSKQFARRLRAKWIKEKEQFNTPVLVHGISPRLHKNDLKWRSIKELSDCQEFDLIIDTLGDTFYGGVNPYGYEVDGQEIVENVDTFADYIRLVCAKLLPGGTASIVPLASFFYDGQNEEKARELLGRMGKENGVKFEIINLDKKLGFKALRIGKKAEQTEDEKVFK